MHRDIYKKFWFLLFLVIFFSSCRGLYKKSFITAGTYLEIISVYPKASSIVYKEFRRLDKIFNKYDPDSEISRLNRERQLMPASVELIEVMDMALDLQKISRGAFNVSCGRLYDFWKEYINSPKEVFPSAQEVGVQIEGCIDGCILIDRKLRRIAVENQEAILDLGAIAKGYMVDRAVEKLKEEGIDSALINAGGDIYCLGRNRSKPWRVGIRDPQNKESLITKVSVVSSAIATSGGYEQFFIYQGRNYSHLIDPRTGYPVRNNILSVSVEAPDCVLADALATYLFVAGFETAKEFALNNPYTTRVFIVTIDKGDAILHIFDNLK